MVASSTPAGQPVFRFHAVRSPNDQVDDLPEFFFIEQATESAGLTSGKRSYFVLDALTGILSVAPDVFIQQTVTRNKGTQPYLLLFNSPEIELYLAVCVCIQTVLSYMNDVKLHVNERHQR